MNYRQFFIKRPKQPISGFFILDAKLGMANNFINEIGIKLLSNGIL